MWIMIRQKLLADKLFSDCTFKKSREIFCLHCIQICSIDSM